MLCAALCVACGDNVGFDPQYPEIPSEVTITANESGGWSLSTVSVKAGGTVTWIIPDGVPITEIWLNPFEPNEEMLKVVNGSVTRSFPTPGRFHFCGRFCPVDVLSGPVPYYVQVY
jgi:hypothetical protein